MSWNPWLILLSTLSRLDSGPIPSPRVALFGADSSDVGRSNRRGSALPGVVGDIMEATLMLLANGETSGCGIIFVVTGDGVLSVGDDR
jgi:hypothetical protein